MPGPGKAKVTHGDRTGSARNMQTIAYSRPMQYATLGRPAWKSALADGIEGLNTRRTILRARGEECPAAYDRVPGRQGLLSKRRLKLSQRLTHTRLCSLQLGGRGLAACLPGARFADALAGPDGSHAVREDAVKLAARADAELGEDVAEVGLYGARAEDQPGADFRVGQPVAGQPGDLGLPCGQLNRGGGGAGAGGLAGGPQLGPGSFGACFHAHRFQHAMGGAQLLPSGGAAALPAQPFPVPPVGGGQRGQGTGPPEAGYRLAG